MNSQLQLLVFNLDDRQFGLHLTQVQRVIRAVDAAPLPDAPDTVLGAIDLQGTIVPLFNVRRRFAMIEREVSPDDQFIIARASSRTVALAVDTVTDIIQRPTDQIIAAEKILDHLELIAGVVQLEEGLALIHDLDRFLSLDQERALDESLARQPIDASH